MAHTNPPADQGPANGIDRWRVGSAPVPAIEPQQRILEPALQKNDDRFRQIFDAVPGMVCVLSPAGEVELLNEQVLKYFGRTFDELKSWAMTDAVHPDDLPRVIAAWQHSVQTGEHFETEQRQRRADGVYRWQQSRARPVRDPEGRITAWYMVITDIDDLRQTTDALRSSEQFARGQGEALRRILDALAHESSPDRMIEHVLRTMIDQLRAHSCSVWVRDDDSGLLHFKFALVQGEFRTASDARYGASFPLERGRDLWPGVDIFRSGQPYVMEDVREGLDFPWRSDLLAQGIVTILAVPMLVAAQVRGIVGVRFVVRRSFQPEELQLAQTLANQAMLAMQLSHISAQSRQTAVLAERNRMARDIHDTLAQGFTGVIVQLEAAADATARGLTAEAADHLKRADNLARESLQDARRSVRALRPQALEEQDLPGALDDMLRKMTAGTTLRTRFAVTGASRPLPFDCEENLLRIAQEVLTNALRHAHAAEFAVQLAFADDKIHLELRDNGRGFDASKRSDGFGLLGIRERAEQMGGQLTVTTAPGQGTAMLIVLPLAALPSRTLP